MTDDTPARAMERLRTFLDKRCHARGLDPDELASFNGSTLYASDIREVLIALSAHEGAALPADKDDLRDMLEAVVDIYFDGIEHAPGEGAYSPGAFRFAMDEARILLAAPVSAGAPTPVVAEPVGWKLVPIEPTALMLSVGDNPCPGYNWVQLSSTDVWRAMLDAAPPPPAAAPVGAVGVLALALEALRGVRIVANTGALADFEGEPWLRRVDEAMNALTASSVAQVADPNSAQGVSRVAGPRSTGSSDAVRDASNDLADGLVPDADQFRDLRLRDS